MQLQMLLCMCVCVREREAETEMRKKRLKIPKCWGRGVVRKFQRCGIQTGRGMGLSKREWFLGNLN